MLNTVVTSDIGAKIAKSYGVKVVSTLTGFKFIGEQAKLIEKNNEAFFFGYEESFGYVVKDFVRDKDSLQAMTLISDAVNYYKSQHKTFLDVLEEIYHKYGYYLDGNVNLTFMGEAGAKQIENILKYFRNNKFPDLKISIKEDYLLSKRYGKTITDIDLPKSNFLKYILNDGSWFVLRPSGTEPKMKIYICTIGSSQEEALLKETEIKNIVLSIIERVK
jgi:phosphoglucomutase